MVLLLYVGLQFLEPAEVLDSDLQSDSSAPCSGATCGLTGRGIVTACARGYESVDGECRGMQFD